MSTFPAYFVSHGAPTMVIDPIPGHVFLRNLGPEIIRAYGRPTAILIVSAHWEEALPTVSAAARPETIHDFYGFPDELYRLRYPAPGAPDLAKEIAATFRQAGLPVAVSADRGLDHGAWCPLMLGFPDADIPSLQVSLQHGAGARLHWRLGEALRKFRSEGVLVIGSGSMTHNLRAYFSMARSGRPMNGAMADWVEAFTEWMARETEAQNIDHVIDWDTLAPHGHDNHPSDEHFMPFFVALGAATPGLAPKRIHKSAEGGVLALDAYRFD